MVNTHVPIEAISSDDSIPVVYKKSGDGVVKQAVVTGAMNDDDAGANAGSGFPFERTRIQ